VILISIDEGDRSCVEAVDLLLSGATAALTKLKAMFAVEPEQVARRRVGQKKSARNVSEELKRKPIVRSQRRRR